MHATPHSTHDISQCMQLSSDNFIGNACKYLYIQIKSNLYYTSTGYIYNTTTLHNHIQRAPINL